MSTPELVRDVNEVKEDVASHLENYTNPHLYEDEGEDPDYTGVKYRLVWIDGMPYGEVVEVPE